ncbi:MAG: glycosyltransferase family 1 protein [Acidobacteria bacterium]|nr:glycosyltransferase family 1 protein [Acidobacteriota bacterium]
MGFQVQPIRDFLVRPALPASLARLPEIAYNLLWGWDHHLRSLFRRLDPVMWRGGHNPVLMLSQLPQDVIEKASKDPRYLAIYRRACERLDNYLASGNVGQPGMLVGYFSMEYGIVDCLQIYSGGLGVLSGDHLKASSDAGVPLVGVGLLYQKGYLRQVLNPDGWQQERYPVNEFPNMPVTPWLDTEGGEITVSVKLPLGVCHIKVWEARVGKTRLMLLDTNIPANENPEVREITNQLYGGDAHTRIRQEIVLGVGGLRALKAAGLKPTVFHMNEGHSAFLAVERVRVLMREEGLTFDEALDASRTSNVFTTHTSVPAGIDRFDASLVHEYMAEYCHEAGIGLDQFFALGRSNPANPGEQFTMAILAMKTSSYRNAVSVLHRDVSQEMWQDLWPQLPVWEVPITSVTNGVHLPTWLNSDLAAIYDNYLQPDWREGYQDGRTWHQIEEIPEQELWESHKRRKRQLVNYIREKLVSAAVAGRAPAAEVKRLGEIFDPDVFTIGFARRFATYKRATLIFRDFARLKKILNRAGQPVQLVIAGKAHPKDHPGKTYIREIVQLARDNDVAHRVVFIENYGLQVAREMVQGVDLWLNNPKRGEEACGTSGMKAALNGVLNLSVLDGWWDEAFETSGGWAIGDREPYEPDQDDIHASAVYSMLENEIVPMYYANRVEGVPHDWMMRVKTCLKNMSPMFNSQRMIHNYMTQLYEPAHQGFTEMSRHGFQAAREHTSWSRDVARAWERIRFVDLGSGPGDSVVSGHPIPLRAGIHLAGLSPADVRVEAVVGRLGANGQLQDTEVVVLPPAGEAGESHVFGRDFVPSQTGRLGYSLRVSPNHSDDPLTRPCHNLIKWGA